MPDYLSRKEAAEYLQGKGLQYTDKTLTKSPRQAAARCTASFGSRAVYTPADLTHGLR